MKEFQTLYTIFIWMMLLSILVMMFSIANMLRDKLDIIIQLLESLRTIKP